MDHSHTMHRYADAAQISGLGSRDCMLYVVQQPVVCKAAVGKEKDRKPVDPPPIVQLKISHQSDPSQSYLHSPCFFLSCSVDNDDKPVGSILGGTLVSSLHRLKGPEGDGAFFVFADIIIKVEGTIRLRFDLYEVQGEVCVHVGSTKSNPFPVVSGKTFTGMSESTPLTRSFSEQGCRLRLRKEPRTMLKPNGPADPDYQPRTYQRGGRSSHSQHSRPAILPEIPRGVQDQGGQLMGAPTNPPKIGRRFSVASHGSGTQYEEPLSKRIRTGSENSQNQSFDQQQGLSDDSSQYQPGGMYSDPRVQPFNTLQQTNPQTYGYNYAQSPQETARDDYFERIPNNPGRSVSYSGPSRQLSPQTFPPHAIRSQQSPYYGTSPMMHPTQRALTTDYNTGVFTPRLQHPTNMPIMPGMEMGWGRLDQHATYQTGPGISGVSESQGYEAYSSISPNITGTSVPGFPITTGPPTGSLGGY